MAVFDGKLAAPLDLPPPFGKIGVVGRKLPDGVQVIGQQNPCGDFKRIFLPGLYHGFAQGGADVGGRLILLGGGVLRR